MAQIWQSQTTEGWTWHSVLRSVDERLHMAYQCSVSSNMWTSARVNKPVTPRITERSESCELAGDNHYSSLRRLVYRSRQFKCRKTYP
ncbi:hypothetical protein NL676_021468 [Syzygium grande]|nr:hypothetical protein NL676_021468 [Syzygium grande]